MAFYVGQKVVCVKADNEVSPQYLREGAVYTVSGFNGPFGLVLAEVKIAKPWGGFRRERFRPITERKTSIEIFKAMLNPSKQEVSA